MNALTGSVWRMTDVRTYDDKGREQPFPLGPQAVGVISFETERMIGAIGDARAPAPPGEPPRRYASYTGSYRFDGSELVVDVDAASSPDLMGQQVRGVRFEGEARMILLPPRNGNLTVEVGWERLR
jgi:hypothetical protein